MSDKYIPAIDSLAFLVPTSGKPCVGGPRKRPVPAEGRTYKVDLFLLRRVLDGSLSASPESDYRRNDDKPASPGPVTTGAAKADAKGKG